MSAADGIPLAEAVRDAADAIGDGGWVGLGGAATAVAGGTAQLIADPIGGILGAGFGFVLEHVPLLRESLDLVSGDEAAIDALVTAWQQRVAAPLSDAVDGSRAATERLLTGWEGTGAAAFADHAADLAGRGESLATAARAAAAGIRTAGTLVLAVRDFIRDELARFLGWLAAGYVIAAASSVPTGGASVATWMNTAVLRGAQLAQRFGRAIARLTERLTALTSRLGGLGDAVAELHRGLAGVTRSAATVARAARHGDGVGALGADLTSRWVGAAPSTGGLAANAAKAARAGGIKALGDGWKTYSADPSAAPERPTGDP